MTTIPTVVVTPSAAAEAYARAARGGSSATLTQPGGSFGSTMQQAMEQAVQTGHTAEDQATQALQGGGNLTDVVVALSHAEMTLQTATAIRDRVVQAYQDIMKMPI
ncbi:flagellar hook-basal body complex protein FliE [Rhodopila sp.]|uniref:flagellar hook-basal body complex protein FliE n=1 Tax=Rhodopila sp. TaxID=2480087 RepID=UPI003D0C75AB